MDIEVKTLVDKIESIAKDMEGLKGADLSKAAADIVELKGRLDAAELTIRESNRTGANGGKKEDKHATAFKSFLRTGSDLELRTVQGVIGTPADGGYAVPQTIDSNVTRLLQETSDVRSIAKIVTIGGSTGYTHNISLANAASGWVGEATARPTTNSPTLGQIVIVPGELYADPEASQQLIEDANFDVEAWYAAEVADIIGRTENTAFVLGNGTNKPKGFLVYTQNDLGSNAASYTNLNTVTSSTAQAIVYDDVNLLTYAVKPQYRANGQFVCSRQVLQKLMGIKDSQGRPLWQPGMNGQPDTLMGYPIKEFSDMPASLTNATPPVALVFGDFKRGYTIVDRVGMSTLRDPYTNKGFVSFYTRKRVGGGLEDGTAIVGLVVKQS